MSNPDTCMQRQPLKPRILLIEDDPGRIEAFRQWLEGTEFVLEVARSGGRALGALGRGSIHTVAGILLDHDLSDSPVGEHDRQLSVSDVLPKVKEAFLGRPGLPPVLIHSHSLSKPREMQKELEKSRFKVTRIRFELLETEPALFRRWLEEVRESWDPDE